MNIFAGDFNTGHYKEWQIGQVIKMAENKMLTRGEGIYI